MKQTIWFSALPLLKSKTVIIQRGLVDIEPAATRPKYGEMLRREIKDLPKIPVALPDFLFRLRCHRDIRHGAYIFEVA